MTVTVSKTVHSAPPAQWLLDALVGARIFDPVQLGPYVSEFRSSGGLNDAGALAGFLKEAGLLSAYQAEQCLTGQAAKLSLGPFILVEPIGTGSLGTVYQALGRSDRKRYAVKVLPLRSLWNVHLAKQQVQIFGRLPPHPSVVPFVEVDTSGGFHYLAWPYVQGQTFADIVRVHGPRPTDLIVRLVAQVAEGLLLCHSHDVAHGLLKPSNILIGNDGQARLLDLGIGAILSENIADNESMLDTISTANAALGMLEFAAPETLHSPTQRTPAGDIYSLGCTLYFLLTGGMPFPEGNAVDKILAHQTQAPRPIRSVNTMVPEWLERLTMRMMAKIASDRPATADVLAALLAGDYIPPQPVLEVPSDTPPDTDTPLRPTSTPWLLHLTPRTPPPETAASLESPASQRTEASIALSVPQHSDPTDPLMESSAQWPAPAQSPMFGPASSHSVSQFRLQNSATAAMDGHSSTESLPWLLSRSSESGLFANELQWPEPLKIEIPPLPPFAGTFWFQILSRWVFWKPQVDIVQLSIFGPPVISPGDNVALQVFAHTPEMFESVQTLSKAFHQTGELLATGFVQKPVHHHQKLGLHLGVVNAGVDRSEVEFTWRGQPQPRKFDLHVPWESPAGPSPTVLSAGLDHILAGRIAFTLQIRPRKAGH